LSISFSRRGNYDWQGNHTSLKTTVFNTEFPSTLETLSDS